jgi:hypothetical protein
MTNFEVGANQVTVIPVDGNGRVLLFSDVKIEGHGPSYRTLYDSNGLSWKLTPGEYRLKVFLRNLQIKTVPVQVVPGVSIYKPVIQTGDEGAQKAETQIPQQTIPAPKMKVQFPAPYQSRNYRYPVKFPVAYRIHNGNWITTKSINFSNGGICIENAGSVQEGENLYLRLHVPVASVPMECPARVVWLRHKDVMRPCMGMQLFLTNNMKVSLENWLSLIPKL